MTLLAELQSLVSSLAPAGFVLDESPYRWIEVTGTDATSWLQGQLTQDIRGVNHGFETLACLCSPTGQIESLLRLWKHDQAWVTAVDLNGANAFLNRFETMVILEDVSARVLDVDAVALEPSRGDLRSPKICARIGKWDILPIDSTYPWAQESDLHGTIASTELESSKLRVMEMLSGYPRHGFDTELRSLPAEFGPEFLSRFVSFDKGCYTGQEIVMRMQSRGHANRRWVGLVSENPISTGGTISLGDTMLGRVTSAFKIGDFWVGSALVSIAHATEGLVVALESGHAEVFVPPVI